MAKVERKRITFRNEFHNSRSVALAEVVCDGLRISSRQYNRVRRELCGLHDCQCVAFSGPIVSDDGEQYWWDEERTFRANQQAMRFSPPEPCYEYLKVIAR